MTFLQKLQEMPPEYGAYTISNKFIDNVLKKNEINWFNKPDLSFPSPAPVCVLMKNEEILHEEFFDLYKKVYQKFDIGVNTSVFDFHEIIDIFVFDEKSGMIEISWDKISILFTFAGCIAVNLCKTGKMFMVSPLCDWIAAYVEMKLLRWILNQGGWDMICEISK